MEHKKAEYLSMGKNRIEKREQERKGEAVGWDGRKEKKGRQGAALLPVLALCLASLLPLPAVYAGSINGNEQSLVDYMNGTFTYGGVSYVATEAAKARATAYLTQDNVDLTAEQVQRAITKVSANVELGIAEGYLIPANPSQETTAQNSGTSSAATKAANSGSQAGNAENEEEKGGDAANAAAENNSGNSGNTGSAAEASSAGNATVTSAAGNAAGSGEPAGAAGQPGGNSQAAEPEGQADPKSGEAGSDSLGAGEGSKETETDEIDPVTGRKIMGEEEVDALIESYLEKESLPEEEAKREKASLKKGLDITTIAIGVAIVAVVCGAAVLMAHRRKTRRKI